MLLRRAQRLFSTSLQKCYSLGNVPLTTPIETNNPLQERRVLPEEVKVSKVNGFTVVSLEDHSCLSNVSVFVNAGSRYESYDQLGLTHLLRNCAFLSNDDRSVFRIAREIDMLGGLLTATTTRENFIYSSKFLRGNIVQVMDNLGSVITRPNFKRWEVKDTHYLLPLERAQAETTPFTVVMEALHKIAYRSDLGNSLYCPARNDSALTEKHLQSFVMDHFSKDAMVIVGVGVGHGELTNCVETSFSSESVHMHTSMTNQAEYVGGTEMHLPINSDFTYAAIMCQGASRKGAQADLLAAGVLQHILGAEPSGYIKWASNSSSSRLGKAGALVTDLPFSVSSVNLNYSDSGLFGIYLASASQDAGKLMKAAMSEFNEIARGNVSEDDIARGKNQLKTRYLMCTESQDALVEDIASQIALTGAYSPVSNSLALVDAITKDDIVRFARGVFATKASYVCHGNLSHILWRDQLLADVSLKS